MDSTDAIMKYVVPCWKIKKKKTHENFKVFKMVLEWNLPKKLITQCNEMVKLPAVEGWKKYW